MKASILYPSQCYLGEGPLWDAERKNCFWVDIEEKKLYEYHWINKTIKVHQFEHRISLVVQGKDDQLILGLEGGIARYHLQSETLTWMVDIEKHLDKHRCNDGKVDRNGRLWFGTMHREFQQGAGSLYSIDETLKAKKKQDNVTISNGLAWSGDNKRLYFIDSPTNKVQCFLYDDATGNIVFEKDVIIIPTEMGAPDGMAIDENGMLWIAHWGGYGIYQWNPFTGELLGKIDIPAPNVTSCAFVGENLDHLMITTAQQDMSEEDLKKYPHSGDTFIVKMKVKGTAPNKCLL